MTGSGPESERAPATPTALILGEPALEGPGGGHPAGLTPILGRSPLQRHLFHLARLGVPRCVVVPSLRPAPGLAEEARRQAADLSLGRMSVRVADAPETVSPPFGGPADVLLIRAEGVYDARLYRELVRARGPVCLVDGEGSGDGSEPGEVRPIGLCRVPAGELSRDLAEIRAAHFGAPPPAETTDCPQRSLSEMPSYLPDLRRHLRPYWCVPRSAADRKRAARLILDAAQKGVLDFPARFLHPLPENFCVRRLAGTGITPNQVTLATAALAFLGTFLFATGSFGPALFLAAAVNVLDGVDGKLARVKLLSSRFGDRLDHVLDVTFEFSWYLGLGWGLSQASGDPVSFRLGALLIGVMIGARAVSGIYRSLTGRQIHDHRAFDRAFRLVAGRRNVYVVLLVAGFVVGRLETAFRAAFWWAVATLAVYVGRTLVAATGSKRPEPSER